MRHSRYLWILGIALSCLMGLMAWKTPETVLSALAHPDYADSPRAAVQRFWNLLDSRQFELAQEMARSSKSSPEPAELSAWTKALEKNPFLSLQKVEFLETVDPASLKVKVSWVAPPQAVEHFTYSFQLFQEGESWHILNFRRVP
ncbi:MAG: hypothetical protein QMC95_01615 [Desulfitobacteriaceae bacterium]|nr:hypothetical protein [Desulfitobacteriaceae bacterium]MDI6877760.1 hypothetical protein [Desulfitobacteriaceae bacterium]MDI6912901.1 hypothetical protein [Desulfitobacteriaceae bacterium]